MQEIVQTRRLDTLVPAHVPKASTEIPATRPTTRLALLKGFELTRNGVSVPISGGAQHLLAFLAISNRGLRRSRVAGTLWDDVSEERAAGNLRSTIWRLRQTGVELIGVTGDQVRLSAAVAVDIHELGRIARLLTDPSASLGAMDLDEMPLVGDLLPDWDEDWVLLERERQRQVVLHVLDALCERWTRERRYGDAVRAGLAAISNEPLRESSQCALIGAFLAEGNPTEALRQYWEYHHLLRRELGLEPSQRISQLVARLGK